MASGRTHTQITLISGITFSATLAAMGFYSTPFLLAGFIYQILASPDRDIDGGTISEFYLRKYTFVLQHYWQFLWYPYALAMKHRGKSHAVTGTIVRLIYILFPSIMLLIPALRDDENNLVPYTVVAHVLNIPLLIAVYFFISTYGIGVFCLFIFGVFIGDLLHLAADSYYYKG